MGAGRRGIYDRGGAGADPNWVTVTHSAGITLVGRYRNSLPPPDSLARARIQGRSQSQFSCSGAFLLKTRAAKPSDVLESGFGAFQGVKPGLKIAMGEHAGQDFIEVLFERSRGLGRENAIFEQSAGELIISSELPELEISVGVCSGQAKSIPMCVDLFPERKNGL